MAKQLQQLQVMEAFRTRYRSSISSGYNGWVHMLAVAVTGLAVIFAAALMLQNVTLREWLVLPLMLLVSNFCEYASHRWLGHKKVGFAKLFYSRHTGDHHSFFLENAMPWQSVRDWRVVLFPVYLIFTFLLFIVLPWGALLYFMVSPNAAFLLAIGTISGYLFYEVMHFSYHLPDGSFVERVPVWKQLRQLHNLHHRRDVMAKVNFNITLPVFDILLGTLYWEKRPEQKNAERSTSEKNRIASEHC
ncbi:sterol desaturase family protein [Endozoicomonadaceae bacterium StTr2]